MTFLQALILKKVSKSIDSFGVTLDFTLSVVFRMMEDFELVAYNILFPYKLVPAPWSDALLIEL